MHHGILLTRQAAQAFAPALKGKYTLTPCPTISCELPTGPPTLTHPAIFTHSATYLVMPFENTLFGGVTDTLDALFSPWSGSVSRAAENNVSPDPGPEPSSSASISQSSSPYLGEDAPPSPYPRETWKRPVIVADLKLPIRHCLVVRKGVRMEDIKWVRSHEQVGDQPIGLCLLMIDQALGQSSKFLKERLPAARLIHTASTAAAAASLVIRPTSAEPAAASSSKGSKWRDGQYADGDEPGANADNQDDPRCGAAICSKAVLELYEGLEILVEGTQGIDGESGVTRRPSCATRH